MPSVTFVEADGRRHVLDVPVGENLMRAAVNAGLDGIVAECGGAAMCATCHVYVADPFGDRLPPPSVVEDEMLRSTACERTSCSRLSCQIVMTQELDGLVLRLPSTQI